jgi:hypothetical protein
MEHISIFNYEAFYLDFLEGNLNEEETALFLAFMEAHPELKLEDESLVSVEVETSNLDPQFKTNLKQVSFVDTPITLSNVEQFLIAETEGQLSSEKLAELKTFVAANSSLHQTQKLYAAAHLKADLSIVYADKASLKRKKTLVLWPYVSLALAASLTAILFYVYYSGNQLLVNSPTKAIVQTDSTEVVPKKESNKEEINLDQLNQHRQPTTNDFVALSNPTREQEIQTTIKQDRPTQIDRLNLKGLKTIKSKKTDLEIIERNPADLAVQSVNIQSTTDVAYMGFQDMKNPIKPITNRLGDAVKKEVDFRTAKTTSERSGGFYFKIGKLEVSHRKH